MYRVYLDGEMIYDPGNEDLAILNPELDLELNSAGTFTFTLPNEHPYYDLPVKMLSRVEVDRNDEMLFYGRIIEDSIDFYKRKKLTCEGELAFLNDSIQRPAEYHDMTVRGYLQALIESHNEQVESDKQFTVGIVTVTDSNDSLYRYTNYNSTMEEIKEDLIDDLGGYLRVRHSGGVRYLDYLELVDYGETNDQAIRFGVNLLDFSQNADVTEIATVIIPLGERLEESQIEALDMRLTIEDVNGGKDWIQSDEAVELYGRIVKTVVWDDVTLPENLLSKGERYLSDTQWDRVQLEANAVDMNLTDEQTDAFHLGDQLRVVSEPHGLDRYFPLSEMVLYLDSPESNSYTMGIITSPSLIGQLITQTDLDSQLGNISARVSSVAGEIGTTASEVLQEAKDNATILINAATADMTAYADALQEASEAYAKALADGNAELAEQYYQQMKEYTDLMVQTATATGHVVIESPYEEILIMDTEDKSTAQRVWRWNLNGLGYSKTGYSGEFGLAMTMDGAIVADYITSGTMYADRIKGGTLTLGGDNNTDGQEKILDANGNEVGSFDKDGIVATAGEIAGWTIQKKSVGRGAFYYGVDEYGDDADGTYIGTDGIQQGNNGHYIRMAYGDVDFIHSSPEVVNSTSYNFDVTFDGGVMYMHPSGYSKSAASPIGRFVMRAHVLQGYGSSDSSWWFYVNNNNKQVYANGSYLSGSDMVLKSDIEDLPSKYDALFDLLQPKTYHLKGQPEEDHLGFVYQDVVEELEEAGIDPEDSALVEEVEINEETHEKIGAIAYNEIIALLVHEVQTLKTKVEELERKVK